jgi:hypothetical protein
MPTTTFELAGLFMMMATSVVYALAFPNVGTCRSG